VDDSAPADFSVIQDAVNAAASGDVILVRAGSYSGFQITGKGLAILGEGAVGPSVLSQIVVSSTFAGQTNVLSNLAQTSSGSGGASGLLLSFCAGAVRGQDCSFQGQDGDTHAYMQRGGAGARIEQSTDVTFSECATTGGRGDDYEYGVSGWYASVPWGGGHGVDAFASQAALYQSITSSGLPATSKTVMNLFGEVGGSGVQLDGSLLFATGTQMKGGQGGKHALSSYLCSISGGSGDCGSGGNGLRLVGAASNALVQQPNLVPGAAGYSTCPQAYYPGLNGKTFLRQAPGSTAARVTGMPRNLTAPAFVAATSIVNLTVTGAPGDLVYAVAETAAHFQYDAALKGVWSLSYPPQPASNPDAVVPAGGSVTFAITLPTLPATQDAQVYFVQMYVVDAFGQTIASTPRAVTLGH